MCAAGEHCVFGEGRELIREAGKHSVSLVPGLREGCVSLLVDDVHRFGIKDSSRFPHVKWSCVKRKDAGCPASCSTRVLNLDEVETICGANELAKDKAKCLQGVHGLVYAGNIDNHNSHVAVKREQVDQGPVNKEETGCQGQNGSSNTGGAGGGTETTAMKKENFDRNYDLEKFL